MEPFIEGRKDAEYNFQEPFLKADLDAKKQAAPTHNYCINNLILLNLKKGIFMYDEIFTYEKLINKEEDYKNDIIYDSQFSYFRELISILPGHLTTNMIFVSALIRTNSLLCSFISIFFYYLPTLIFVTILSLLDRYYYQFYSIKIYNPDDNYIFYFFSVFIMGICQAVLSLIINRGCILFNHLGYNVSNIILIVAAFIFNNYFDSLESMIFIMIIWGCLCIIRASFNDEFDNFKDRALTKNTNRNIYLSFSGIPAIFTFVCLSLVLLYCLEFYGDEYLNLFIIVTNFKIGCFTTAGGNSMIPLFMAGYSDKITKLALLKGFGLVSLFPGPMFNLATFIGGILNGIFSALLSLLFLLLPSLLILMAALPYPEKFKPNSYLKNFFLGLKLCSIGFIFSAALKLFQEIALANPYVSFSYSILNIISCFIFLYILNIAVPLVLLYGGTITLLYSLMINFLF
jgi:chromate transporter